MVTLQEATHTAATVLYARNKDKTDLFHLDYTLHRYLRKPAMGTIVTCAHYSITHTRKPLLSGYHKKKLHKLADCSYHRQLDLHSTHMKNGSKTDSFAVYANLFGRERGPHEVQTYRAHELAA